MQIGVNLPVYKVTAATVLTLAGFYERVGAAGAQGILKAFRNRQNIIDLMVVHVIPQIVPVCPGEGHNMMYGGQIV